MSYSSSRVEKCKMSLGSLVLKSEKAVKDHRNLVKRTQFEKAPTGQKWDNLNFQMNNDYNELKNIKCVKIHDLVVLVQKKLIGYLWQLLQHQHIMLKIGKGIEKNHAFSAFLNCFQGQYLRILRESFSFSGVLANKFRKKNVKVRKLMDLGKNYYWLLKPVDERLVNAKGLNPVMNLDIAKSETSRSYIPLYMIHRIRSMFDSPKS